MGDSAYKHEEMVPELYDKYSDNPTQAANL